MVMKPQQQSFGGLRRKPRHLVRSPFEAASAALLQHVGQLVVCTMAASSGQRTHGRSDAGRIRT